MHKIKNTLIQKINRNTAEFDTERIKQHLLLLKFVNHVIIQFDILVDDSTTRNALLADYSALFEALHPLTSKLLKPIIVAIFNRCMCTPTKPGEFKNDALFGLCMNGCINLIRQCKFQRYCDGDGKCAHALLSACCLNGDINGAQWVNKKCKIHLELEKFYEIKNLTGFKRKYIDHCLETLSPERRDGNPYATAMKKQYDILFHKYDIQWRAVNQKHRFMLFFECCKNNKLVCAQWLFRVFELSNPVSFMKTSEFHDNLSDCFTQCRCAVAQWLVTEAFVNAVMCIKHSVLCACCVGGNLELVQHIVKWCSITECNMRNEIDPLWCACVHGHLAVAQWLANHFSITDERIYTVALNTMYECCYRGHTHVADWLLDKCAASDLVRHVVGHACEYGHTETLCWILETKRTDFTYHGLRSLGHPFMMSCIHENINAAKCVVDVCNINRARFLKHGGIRVFMECCAQNKKMVDVLQWLTDTFELTAHNVLKTDGTEDSNTKCNANYTACTHGRTHILKWLQTAFPLDTTAPQNLRFACTCMTHCILTRKYDCASIMKRTYNIGYHDALRTFHSKALVLDQINHTSAHAEWFRKEYGEAAGCEVLVMFHSRAATIPKWLRKQWERNATTQHGSDSSSSFTDVSMSSFSTRSDNQPTAIRAVHILNDDEVEIDIDKCRCDNQSMVIGSETSIRRKDGVTRIRVVTTRLITLPNGEHQIVKSKHNQYTTSRRFSVDNSM